MEIAIIAGAITACVFVGTSISNWFFKSKDNTDSIQTIIQNEIKIKDNVELNTKFEIVVIVIVAAIIAVALAYVSLKLKKKCSSINTQTPQETIELQIIDDKVDEN